MSKDTLDITGNKYGNLTAVRYSHTGKNYMHYWVFKCDCGKEITTRKTAVISGHCKSCGCLQKQIAKKEVVKHSVKHNESNKEQARNTSKNRCFELNGKIKCAAELCEELGIKSSTFFQRLKNGLNPFTGEKV